MNRLAFGRSRACCLPRHPRILRIAALAATLVLATPASAGRVSIVSEAELGKSWSLTPETAVFVAGYPAAAADKAQDVCVNLGFKINPDGSTSDYTLMKAWSSGTSDAAALDKLSEPFVQNAAAVVQRWKFVPADKPRAVYTSATMAFRGSQASAEEVQSHCRIADLATFVADAAARSKGRKAEDMKTRELMRSSGSGY